MSCTHVMIRTVGHASVKTRDHLPVFGKMTPCSFGSEDLILAPLKKQERSFVQKNFDKDHALVQKTILTADIRDTNLYEYITSNHRGRIL